MNVPFPSDTEVDLKVPSEEESRINAAGVLAATRPAGGNTEFQLLLMEATFDSMTGHVFDCAALPDVSAEEAAENLQFRNKQLRTPMVHMMALSALVFQPIPPEVAIGCAALRCWWPWEGSSDDPELAGRWAALGDLAEGTLGRMVHDFYQARGFAYPGSPGSAPPLPAQHDWVH